MSARLTPEQVQLRGILEKDWQATVERIARSRGWLIYHAPDNMPRQSRSGFQYVQNIRAGFPDLVLVRYGRLVCAELKRELGKVSPDQTQWLEALRTVPGVEAYLWRPSDVDQVRQVLTLKQTGPTQ